MMLWFAIALSAVVREQRVHMEVADGGAASQSESALVREQRVHMEVADGGAASQSDLLNQTHRTTGWDDGPWFMVTGIQATVGLKWVVWQISEQVMEAFNKDQLVCSNFYVWEYFPDSLEWHLYEPPS